MNIKPMAAWRWNIYRAMLASLLLGWSGVAPAAAWWDTVLTRMHKPIVTITAPAADARVSGLITVSMNSSVGFLVIAGVQFRLDGADFGAEVTAPPYAVAWDTTTTVNGPHTLTAVARGIDGRFYSSATVNVTVANAGAAPAVRTEETDPSVSYTGNTWVHDDRSRNWSGGTASYTRGPDDQVTYAFSGTGVTWIGYRGPQGGMASVYIDNALVTQVDSHAIVESIQAPVFTSSSLAPGPHSLRIVATGTANPLATDSVIVVDAFDVTGSSTQSVPNPPPAKPTRYEETSSAIVYSPGAWVTESTMGWSGGSAQYTASPGAQATFTFNGTGVSWIGYRGRYGGYARVYLDGVLMTQIDTYSATEQVSVPVYTVSGLAAGSHSLMVELTGTSNPAAIASEIAVDAFDVTP